MAEIIVVHSGNIFDSPARALVNPVNTVGVMGAGLAKQFRNRYPAMYRGYRDDCRQGKLAPGSIRVYQEGDGRTIICLPTKQHWRHNSRLEYVQTGLQALARWTEEQPEPVSVAVPPLGCGLGNLDWRQVRPMLLAAARAMPDSVTAYIYAPTEMLPVP